MSKERDRKGYFDHVEDPAEHSFLSKLGENNREAKSILTGANHSVANASVVPERNANHTYADPETLEDQNSVNIHDMKNQSPLKSAHHQSFDGKRSNAKSHFTKAEHRDITTYRDRSSPIYSPRNTNEKGAAVAVGPQTLPSGRKEQVDESNLGYNAGRIEQHKRRFEQEDKEEGVRQLRQKYNQMMRQSLERKAEMEYKRRY